MDVNLLSAIAIYLVVSLTMKTVAAGRHFVKLWNFSMVFPTNARSIIMVMAKRGECVSFCVPNAGCCCTQWLSWSNTCTILMADRVGLSQDSDAVSSIDSFRFKIIWILYLLKIYYEYLLLLIMFQLCLKY